jgi:hypothetical protein
LPSHNAAEDIDGSKLVGSERPDRGAHPAPIEEATSEGTIAMREGLKTQFQHSTFSTENIKYH